MKTLFLNKTLLRLICENKVITIFILYILYVLYQPSTYMDVGALLKSVTKISMACSPVLKVQSTCKNIK